MPDSLPVAQRFTGRVAIVTGAAQGIGAATARRFHQEGARVLLADRDTAVNAIAADLPGSAAMVLDITAADAGHALARDAMSRFGRIDVLVNNAGIGGSRSLEQSDDALIERLIATNLTSVLRITREVTPHLTRPGGSIVNVSSNFGLVGHPGTTAYAVAKAGVAQFTRQLASELGPQGIRVNAVAPGVIETPMTVGHRGNPYYQRVMVDPIPLRRIGRPEDIASVIAFLASEDAAFVNAEVTVADGGWMNARSPIPDPV